MTASRPEKVDSEIGSLIHLLHMVNAPINVNIQSYPYDKVNQADIHPLIFHRYF